MLEQLSGQENLNFFIIPKTKACEQRPLVIALVDSSGSMSNAWQHLRKSFNIFVERFKSHYGSIDDLQVFPFSTGLHVEHEKFLKEMSAYPGGGTEFYPPFAKLDQILSNENSDRPIKIMFISDGESDWQGTAQRLKGHQGRNTSFFSIGVGSAFPFQAAQKFYDMYHNSKTAPAVFQIKNIASAEFQREFEEAEPYVFDASCKVELEKPQYLYPWSKQKETEVFEGMLLVSADHQLKLKRADKPVLPQDQKDSVRNAIELQQIWCTKVLMLPGPNSETQKQNAETAKKVISTIKLVETHIKKQVSDQGELKKLEQAGLQERLEKVADQSFYRLSEVERATLIDTKLIQKTDGLNETELIKQREAKKAYLEPQEVLPAPTNETLADAWKVGSDVGIGLINSNGQTELPGDEVQPVNGHFIWLLLLALIIFCGFRSTRYVSWVLLSVGVLCYCFTSTIDSPSTKVG